MYSEKVTHPAADALPPTTTCTPESSTPEQISLEGAVRSPATAGVSGVRTSSMTVGTDNSTPFAPTREAAEEFTSDGELTSDELAAGEARVPVDEASHAGELSQGDELSPGEDLAADAVVGADELAVRADADGEGEVPRGDPEAIAALEALMFGEEDEILRLDAEGREVDEDGFGLSGLFAGVSDHDLVSSLNVHAIRGAQDALLLARVAVLYRRRSMNPVPSHELGPSGKAGTGMPQGRSRAACQARKEWREAEKARKRELAAKTARVRGGGLRPLTRTELTVAEVVAVLKVSAHAGGRLVSVANALMTRLGHTLLALRAGRLDYRRVQIVEGYFTPLMDDHQDRARREGLSPRAAAKVARDTARALEEYVFPAIWDAHPARVHKMCAGAVMMVDPLFVERRRREKVAERFLTYRKNGDTAEIYARLGAVEAQGVFNVVDAYARLARSQGDERGLGVLRADALTYLILNGHLPDGTVPQPVGEPTIIPGPDAAGGNVPHSGTPTPTPAPEPGSGSGSAGSSSQGARTPSPGDTAGPVSGENCCPERATVNTEPTGSQNAGPTGERDGEAANTGYTGAADGEDIDSACAQALAGLGDLIDPTTTPGRGRPCGQANSSEAVPEATGVSSTAAAPHAAGEGITTPGADSESVYPGTAFTPEPGPDTKGRSHSHRGDGGGSGGSACTCTCTGHTGHRGVNANVNVVMNLDTLLGLNDHPADLSGHGPISADLARDLAFNTGSTWRRLIIDPLTGYLLEYGRTTYRPPKPLDEHVKGRDYTCRVPGCTQPAITCDGDHIVPFPAGQTSASNLCSLCRHHHRLKHEGNWWHRLSTDPIHPFGTVELISPTGHLYLSFPHDYRAIRPTSLPDLESVGIGIDALGWADDTSPPGTGSAWQPRTLAELLGLNNSNQQPWHDPDHPDPGPLPF